MFSESQIASRACDWEELVNAVRRQCRAFTVREISPVCEVGASWLDEHSVDIRWRSGPIVKNIQILLVGDSWPLRVSVSGSAAVEPPRRPDDFRWWNGAPPSTVADLDELESAIEHGLRLAHESVSRLLNREYTGA